MSAAVRVVLPLGPDFRCIQNWAIVSLLVRFSKFLAHTRLCHGKSRLRKQAKVTIWTLVLSGQRIQDPAVMWLEGPPASTAAL